MEQGDLGTSSEAWKDDKEKDKMRDVMTKLNFYLGATVGHHIGVPESWPNEVEVRRKRREHGHTQIRRENNIKTDCDKKNYEGQNRSNQNVSKSQNPREVIENKMKKFSYFLKLNVKLLGKTKIGSHETGQNNTLYRLRITLVSRLRVMARRRTAWRATRCASSWILILSDHSVKDACLSWFGWPGIKPSSNHQPLGW